MKESNNINQQNNMAKPKEVSQNNTNAQSKPQVQNKSKVDDAIMKGMTNVSDKIDNFLLNKLSKDQNSNNNQNVTSVDLSTYFNVRSLTKTYYSDYQLVALILTFTLLVVLRLLNVYSVLNWFIILGYLSYILFLIVKEKLWNLMVQ